MRIKKSFIVLFIVCVSSSLFSKKQDVQVKSLDTCATTTDMPAKYVASPINKNTIANPQLDSVKSVAKTVSFNEMIVDNAKKMCNDNMYKVFWRNGGGFIDFWATGNEMNVNLEYAYTSMRLLYNNIKSCEIINGTVIEQVSRMIPRLFERYFQPSMAAKNRFKIVREDIEDLMLDRFIERLDLCHSQVDIFVSKLSFDVTNLVKSRISIIRQEEEEREYRDKLRNILIRFMDLMASKAFWYVDSYRSTWQSFMEIASYFHAAGVRGVINDQDNLEELWDTLTKRFVWYLDLQGSRLPVEFYTQIEDDLKNSVVFFLEVPPQDEGIKTHKQMIAEAVVQAKAKAIAYEKQGIISDQAIAV